MIATVTPSAEAVSAESIGDAVGGGGGGGGRAPKGNPPMNRARLIADALTHRVHEFMIMASIALRPTPSSHTSTRSLEDNT